MNSTIKKTIAALSAAVVSVCGCVGSFNGLAADETAPKEVEVVFDFVMDESSIIPGYRTDGEKASIADFASYKINAGELAKIPLGNFRTDTHNMSGWTVDGFYGLYCGETYSIPEDYAEDKLVFKAVWYDKNDTSKTSFSYNLEFEGQPVERPDWLKDETAVPGMIFEPNYTMIKGDGFLSSGLTDGENIYKIGTKFVVTDKDMVFTPVWRKEIFITYLAGDVDRLNGNSTYKFDKLEGGKDELAGADRFSRTGFNISGWLSDLDGTVYKPGQTIEIPGEDMTLTAVWEPRSYVVVFITGEGGTPVKVNGKTDETIICPEPGHTVAGKSFAGWKDNEGNIHAVGDEYVIPGALPGLGISLKGVWVEGEAPVVTTTAPAVTTTTATTTTAATTTTVTTTGAIGDNSIEFTDVIAEINKNYIAFEENGKYNFSSAGMLPDKLDGLKAGDTVSIGFWYTETETGRTINYISYADVVGSAATTTTVTSTEPTVTTTTTPNGETKTVAGDANCDGKVTIADATAILQAIGNADEYSLTEQGTANADVDGKEGISAADALAIQQYDAKIVDTLPVK
ncbi:MAG: dockerin type I repeat-containing protein [Ruminococcus sp.]|nr:dockerin type I repeat-containing protein [Ruminococcus sp.]